LRQSKHNQRAPHFLRCTLVFFVAMLAGLASMAASVQAEIDKLTVKKTFPGTCIISAFVL